MYIIENGMHIKEVIIVNISNGFYQVCFTDRKGSIKLRESRLYKTIGEAATKNSAAKNISVFELAYRTKTSQSHIYQIEGGSQNMSIELLFKIADTLETAPNTILGVKNNVASVDEALNELPLEMKSKLSVLFGAMINQIKEQDVIN